MKYIISGKYSLIVILVLTSLSIQLTAQVDTELENQALLLFTHEEFEMAGKTGTSQVRNITAAERARGVTRNRDLPWERRDHALFVSFAPHVNPRIACCVVVEHGGGGSVAAAPIARDIVLQALYGGLPPLTAYPSSQRGTIQAMREKLILRDPELQTGERIRT